MQCYFFLLLSNIQKLNKILLKCFDFDFYENILWRRMHTCMHGSNDDGFGVKTTNFQFLKIMQHKMFLWNFGACALNDVITTLK